jgi:hypothetical protein
MNEGERSGLAVMRDCWLGGGMAADLAPPEWKEIVAAATAADRERLLLAIAGQALDVCFRPAAPKTLNRRAPLPRLALPTLPERWRPLFRAALRQAPDGRGRMRVAALAAARGFVAHPLDWMPAASDLEAPDVYAPWVDWRAQDGGKSPRALDELSVDSWDDFYPAARRIALADIRRSDPAKARSLLEAKAAGETAETRLALIELLRVKLSAADVPYLRSLAADRSGKIKQLAARLLARTGQSGAVGEAAVDAAELAGFIEPGKAGWLRRRAVYAPRELKSQVQIQRRAELFENCQLIDLAGQLGASEVELIAGWQLGGKDDADRAFAGMVVASGSDAAVAQLAERLFAIGDVASLRQFLPRLGEAGRRDFVRAVLAGGSGALALLDADEIETGTFDRDNLMRSRLYKEIRAAIADRKETDRQTVDLGAFGFLATVSAADAIMQDLVAAGLAPADPQLAVLRLNAVLGQTRLEENKR